MKIKRIITALILLLLLLVLSQLDLESLLYSMGQIPLRLLLLLGILQIVTQLLINIQYNFHRIPAQFI